MPSNSPSRRPTLTNPYSSFPSISSRGLLSASSVDLPSSAYTPSDWSDPTASTSTNHAHFSTSIPKTEEPEQQKEGSTRIFSQLEVIKKLHEEIADAHAKLEGVQSREGDSRQTGLQDSWWADAKLDMESGMGRITGTRGEREKTGKAYTSMADDFADRQKGVAEIMAKLGDLSSALKTFHDLPSPVLFPLTSSKTTKSPPFHPKSRVGLSFRETTATPNRADTAPHPDWDSTSTRPRLPERTWSYT